MMMLCEYLDIGKKLNTGHRTPMYYCGFLGWHVDIRECKQCIYNTEKRKDNE